MVAICCDYINNHSSIDPFFFIICQTIRVGVWRQGECMQGDLFSKLNVIYFLCIKNARINSDINKC